MLATEHSALTDANPKRAEVPGIQRNGCAAVHDRSQRQFSGVLHAAEDGEVRGVNGTGRQRQQK
jgi:hypothetical protein